MWAVVAAALVVGAVAAAVLASRSDPGPKRSEVVAYEAAIKPYTTEWGKIEVQGMRPAVADLASGGGVPAELIAGEAHAWVESLRDLRTKLAGVVPPPALRHAAVLFDRAIERYIAAAEAFEAAAGAPAGVQREQGIDRGATSARDGDRLYNQASMELQAARKAAKLPESPDFPNHPAD